MASTPENSPEEQSKTDTKYTIKPNPTGVQEHEVQGRKNLLSKINEKIGTFRRLTEHYITCLHVEVLWKSMLLITCLTTESKDFTRAA